MTLALIQQLPASLLCMAHCCCTPLVNTHAARGSPCEWHQLAYLRNPKPDAGRGGCLASAWPTNCERRGLWLAPLPLGNRLSKDIAGPSVRPFIVLLARLKSAAEIVLRSCFWNSYKKPMPVCFPVNVSIGASLQKWDISPFGCSSRSVCLLTTWACASAEIGTLWASGKKERRKHVWRVILKCTRAVF